MAFRITVADSRPSGSRPKFKIGLMEIVGGWGCFENNIFSHPPIGRGGGFYFLFLGQGPGEKCFWTYSLSYVSFGAFSEEEHWFRAKGFHHNKLVKIHLSLHHIRN